MNSIAASAGLNAEQSTACLADVLKQLHNVSLSGYVDVLKNRRILHALVLPIFEKHWKIANAPSVAPLVASHTAKFDAHTYEEWRRIIPPANWQAFIESWNDAIADAFAAGHKLGREALVRRSASAKSQQTGIPANVSFSQPPSDQSSASPPLSASNGTQHGADVVRVAEASQPPLSRNDTYKRARLSESFGSYTRDVRPYAANDMQFYSREISTHQPIPSQPLFATAPSVPPASSIVSDPIATSLHDMEYHDAETDSMLELADLGDVKELLNSVG